MAHTVRSACFLGGLTIKIPQFRSQEGSKQSTCSCWDFLQETSGVLGERQEREWRNGGEDGRERGGEGPGCIRLQMVPGVQCQNLRGAIISVKATCS